MQQLDWTYLGITNFVIRDSYTLFNWHSFWNQLKNKQLRTNNYNCQIKYFILLWAFFFALKNFPGYPIPVHWISGNCVLESSILNISWGNMLPGTNPPPPPPPPPAPAAWTAQVRQLNLCFQYFQMLPKTLHYCTNNTLCLTTFITLIVLKLYFFLLVCRMKDL